MIKPAFINSIHNLYTIVHMVLTHNNINYLNTNTMCDCFICQALGKLTLYLLNDCYVYLQFYIFQNIYTTIFDNSVFEVGLKG